MAENRMTNRKLGLIVGRSAVGVLLVVLCSAAWGQTPAACPVPPPSHSITSPTPPTDSATCDGIAINDFDDFSWRIFIAMIWPAQQGQRGVPDPTQTGFPVTGPLVFETYKADWETFPPVSAPNPPPQPSLWQDFAGTVNPCGPPVNVGWGDMVLAADTKFGNLALAGFGNFFVGPIISSGFSQSPAHQHYLRYQASYNQTEYSQIRTAQWYLQSKLGNVDFCFNGATVGGQACPSENSIDVKSSWMNMDGVPANLQSRYYTKLAWIKDSATGTCSQHTMGLLGLHIVTKTPTRPQWIWSTFEQIDNVPVITGATPTSNTVFNVNDGTGTAMPPADPYCIPGQPGNQNGCPGSGNPPVPAVMPATASQATRFNVTRKMPIGIGAATTPTTNSSYQALLAQAAPNSPWQYYQLVMTQWPTPGSTPANQGTPAFTFPGNSATSSFSNVTMETFDQGSIYQGCMYCHNFTAHPGGKANGNDFLWSLAINAYPDQAGVQAVAKGRGGFNPTSVAAFNSLSALQQSALKLNSKAPNKKKKPAAKPKQ